MQESQSDLNGPVVLVERADPQKTKGNAATVTAVTIRPPYGSMSECIYSFALCPTSSQTTFVFPLFHFHIKKKAPNVSNKSLNEPNQRNPAVFTPQHCQNKA